MIQKTESMSIKILELIALVGDISSKEIQQFFKSESYVRKVITGLINDKLIKKSNREEKITYRLTINGKKRLKDYLPEIFDELLQDRRSMNVVRDDKGYIERRKKLLEILTLLHRADIKIFPDEKNLLRKHSVNTWADNTDDTDIKSSLINNQPEFYTSVEVKELIPDFNIAKGSRALGILISYGNVYIVYYTYTGDLLWRKETEMKFRECALTNISHRLYGKRSDVYLLVFADKDNVAKEIVERYVKKTCGKIHPSVDLPNMIFALKDSSLDSTLKIITKPINPLVAIDEMISSGVLYDGHFPFLEGRSIENDNLYVLKTFLFDLYKVAAGINACKMMRFDLVVHCFSYQEQYLRKILDKDILDRVTFKLIYVEEGSETDDEER